MKLCFSTLGCPEWGFNDVFATAKDLGFDGIEIRGVGSEIDAYKVPELSGELLGRTLERLRAARLALPLLTSGACVCDGARVPAVREDLAAYLDLANRAGVPYVRVLADYGPRPSQDARTEPVAERLRECCAQAEKAGVTLLVETNGVFADSRQMAALLEAVGSESLKVLWDVHHTVRVAGEAPAETLARLGPQIRHVHVKDSVLENGQIRYRVMGYGDIPVAEAVKGLHSIGYEGFISLEWVRRWSHDLENAGIVFPQFIYYMKNLLRSL